MSQICYSIIHDLMVQKNHVRGIAKDLGTNQTTIARKIKELEEKNIVDYEIIGRNKVYTLKNTLEAKEEIMILEHKRLIEFLAIYPRLRKIVENIKRDENIGLALLFGSYAKKTPDKESDIDIYADTDEDTKRRIEKLDSKISLKHGRFDKNSHLAKEIISNHVIIKGVERYYQIIQSVCGSCLLAHAGRGEIL